MGGAGWADPLPAMRAALRDCGIRLTHKRVAGDGNCFLHALACAAGTTARERASVFCTSLAELAVFLRHEIAAYSEDKAPLADCRDALEAMPPIADAGPSDVRAALVRRVRTNAEWLGTPFLLAAETVLSKLLGARVQILVVYGEHGPRVRSRHGDAESLEHAAAAMRDHVCIRRRRVT